MPAKPNKFTKSVMERIELEEFEGAQPLPVAAVFAAAPPPVAAEPDQAEKAETMKPVGFFMALALLFIIKQELVIQKIDDDLSADKKTFLPTKEARIKFIGFAILTFLYAFAFNYAGFILATLVIPAVGMFFLGVRSIKVLTLVPILLTVGVYVAFKIILKVSLPTGILGI